MKEEPFTHEKASFQGESESVQTKNSYSRQEEEYSPKKTSERISLCMMESYKRKGKTGDSLNTAT